MRRVDWDSLVSAPTHHATGMSTELYFFLPAQATGHRLTLKSHFQITCLPETPFVQHIASLIFKHTLSTTFQQLQNTAMQELWGQQAARPLL